MTAMTVHAQCADVSMGSCADSGADLDARRAALRVGCACAVEQHYVYRWDELNRLAEARRYDRSASTGGVWVLETRQRYRYDGANARVIKQTLDQNGCGGGGMPLSCERTAIYPYPGDFERRGLITRGREYRVDSSLESETQYVIAGARTVFRSGGSAGAGFDREQRLVVPLASLIGTTSAAFDVRTGRLLECSTYYPTGGRETFLNDDSALTAPEPSGFTGKEADEEVGLVYFGERYLVPRLGRWASPDPLHVHAVGGGEALNSYHYVGGDLLAARDPLGLNVGTREITYERTEGSGASHSVSAEEQIETGYEDLMRGFSAGERAFFAISGTEIVLTTAGREAWDRRGSDGFLSENAAMLMSAIEDHSFMHYIHPIDLDDAPGWLSDYAFAERDTDDRDPVRVRTADGSFDLQLGDAWTTRRGNSSGGQRTGRTTYSATIARAQSMMRILDLAGQPGAAGMFTSSELNQMVEDGVMEWSNDSNTNVAFWIRGGRMPDAEAAVTSHHELMGHSVLSRGYGPTPLAPHTPEDRDSPTEQFIRRLEDYARSHARGD